MMYTTLGTSDWKMVEADIKKKKKMRVVGNQQLFRNTIIKTERESCCVQKGTQILVEDESATGTATNPTFSKPIQAFEV